ncbi:hypothetical protein AYO44_07630 [Planctomycetaceae bacterium SCGC AG-212-F19]|nr:hypothetical protein AYO44_07630 [Planctomycetaceae bacterium SCGC AG-212-F19]
MTESTKVDEIRRVALDSVDSSRRLRIRVIALFGLLEAGCWIAYLVLAYYDFPTSVLIGVAALLVYSTVFASILGLRCHLDNSTQRILKALESLAPGNEERQK